MEWLVKKGGRVVKVKEESKKNISKLIDLNSFKTVMF